MRTKENNPGEVLKRIKLRTGLVVIASLFVIGQLILVEPSGNSLNSGDLVRDKKTIKFQASAKTSSQPPCNEIDWAVWNPIAGKSAAATVKSQGSTINITMNSSFEFESTSQIERYEAFKRFKGNVLNTTVPRTSWSRGPGGIITICFSQIVKEPILLLASLGSYKERIHTTINFSEPYIVFYNAGGIIADNNNSLTGREGYALIKFPGDIKCITISSSTYENFTDLTWGIPVCPDGAPKPASALIAAAKPEPTPKPPVLPKPTPAVTATPEPAPKLVVDAPKPVPVVAAVKPEPAPKPLDVPKPTPILIAAKPESVPKPPVLPKPTPAVVTKPQPAPKTVVDAPKPAPVVAAVKPEPAPKAVVNVPKSTPTLIAAIPTPAPKPPILPKSTPAVIAKQEPAAKPVNVPKSTPPVSVAIAAKPPVLPKPIPSAAAIPKSIPKPIDLLLIRIWDSDGMDYDSVSLKLNGKQIGPKSIQLPLYKMYGASEFTYPLQLQSGDNTLEIYAISEGVKPYTTIGLQIMYEDKPKKVYFILKAKETTVIHL